MAGTGNLEDLARRIIAFRDERDWKQFHSPKDVAISLVLEASELLEVFQWKNGELSSDQKQRIGEELADVLYWVVLLSHDLGIDLPAVFERKMAKNEAKYPVAKSKGSSKKYTELG
jgi:NTP pyrophosphatase (non-canonical NTP hydrolase)